MKEILSEPFLNSKSYKIIGYVLIITTVLILFFPLINLKKISYYLVPLYDLFLMDWISTFFKHHFLGNITSIILGGISSLIIAILMLFYICLCSYVL